jgi:hypothetical protein
MQAMTFLFRPYKILSGFLQRLCIMHSCVSKHKGVIHEKESDYRDHLIDESGCMVTGRIAHGCGRGKGCTDNRPRLPRLKHAGEDRDYPHKDGRLCEVRYAQG